MSVQFRTLTLDKCPYCGCTEVVEERIDLRDSGEYEENDKGRKEHRYFKCGLHAYSVYEHKMPDNTWGWVCKAEGRCKKILTAKDQLIDFMKCTPNFSKEVYSVVVNALNSIDLSKVDRRDY